MTNCPQPDAESTWLESISSTCGTIIVLLFVMTFVFQNFLIPSRSMASTLLVGDHVVVDRVSWAPRAQWAHILPYQPIRRGEPIVFYKPVLEPDGEELIMVKRVVGIPGDRIHLRAGVLYVNGAAQSEPFAAKPTALNYDPYRDDFPRVGAETIPRVTARWTVDLPNHIRDQDLGVPADSYFVMGDNRTNSLDSRYWGFVPRENVLGRPLVVYWSMDMAEQNEIKTTVAEDAHSWLDEATHFFQRTRWGRTLHPVK
ncbi:MAG TPA: signal peptidase I [Acidobacteriaceae bacterium]|jgi:signal peptidase I|nr:signal peptidase I [Acidobacteriaceae bacterium]